MAATPVKMPELGESITEGTITRWLKQEGDRVEVDEPLFEISTDKVDTEVPSPVAGVLKTIKVQVDETVEVGAELAVIEQDGAAAGGQAEGGEEQAEAGGAEAEAGEPEAEAEPEPEAEAEGEAEGGDREAVAAEVAEAEPGSEEAGGGEQPAAAEGEDREAQAGDQEQQAPPRAAASGDGDTTTVRMPELGESITEGTITRWLKQEGDQVQVDEPLFEISTDKVDTEIPSPVAGVLQSIKVQVDETVEVGAELAVIGTAGGGKAPAAGKPTDERAEEPQAEAAEEGAGAEAERAAQAGGDGKPKAAARQRAEAPRARAGNGKAAVVSPLVRRLAREHGIDLSEVEGTGSGGRVRREDVEAYVERRGKEPAARPAERPAERPPAQRPAAAAPSGTRVAVPLPKGLREEVVPATRLRRLIAERMVSSLQTSAQLTSALEVDMTKVMRLRARAKDAFKQREGVSLSPLPFCVLALVGAVKQHPNVNSAMDEDGNLHLYKDVHLGVAVDTPKGLYVPVVKNADSLNLAGIAKAIADVAARTREGKIRPDELSGSTITVTNTGSRGVVWDTPIINQPNAAIFATPAIVKRPVVVEDPELGEVVAVRQVMQGVLTYDHRIIDGADAARFLNTIKELLEEADFEGELGLPKE